MRFLDLGTNIKRYGLYKIFLTIARQRCLPPTSGKILLELQNIVLEMIATGETLSSTIARMCLEAEKLSSDAVCSVLTVDRAGLR